MSSGPTGYTPWVPTDGNPLYIDPDDPDNKWVPKPPNERDIGISSEPDRDTATEVEI